MKLSITNKNLEKIFAHAKKTYPDECCGLLAGISDDDKKIVKEILETKNISPNKRLTYKISPEDYLKFLKKTDKKYRIFGCYHSHPNLAAKPSFVDLTGAIPGFLYVIVSLDEKKILGAKAWVFVDDWHEFREIMVIEKK